MSKTRVTLTKFEPDIQVEKRAGGTYLATRITYTVGGTEEVKAFAASHLKHDNGKQVASALSQLATKTLPVDVVIHEEKVDGYDNIIAILPGTTPEENPRGPKVKKAWTGGGFNKGSYAPKDVKGMNRGVALKVAGFVAGIGAEPKKVIEISREFEVYLNELEANKEAKDEAKAKVDVPKLDF